MLDTVEINHVQHISFAQSRLTDAVSVILSELLSYEHPPKHRGVFLFTDVSQSGLKVEGAHGFAAVEEYLAGVSVPENLHILYVLGRALKEDVLPVGDFAQPLA